MPKSDLDNQKTIFVAENPFLKKCFLGFQLFSQKRTTDNSSAVQVIESAYPSGQSFDGHFGARQCLVLPLPDQLRRALQHSTWNVGWTTSSLDDSIQDTNRTQSQL